MKGFTWDMGLNAPPETELLNKQNEATLSSSPGPEGVSHDKAE